MSAGGAGPAVGVLLPVASLEEVQGRIFTRPTLLLAERMGGNEDIPQNVQVRARREVRGLSERRERTGVCSRGVCGGALVSMLVHRLPLGREG